MKNLQINSTGSNSVHMEWEVDEGEDYDGVRNYVLLYGNGTAAFDKTVSGT